jgi:hypothetical protein
MESDTTLDTKEPAPEQEQPAEKQVHENTLKAARFAQKFAGKDTEAVIIISKGGKYSLMDMQKPNSYLVSTSPLNDRWRECLKKPIAVDPKKNANTPKA